MALEFDGLKSTTSKLVHCMLFVVMWMFYAFFAQFMQLIGETPVWHAFVEQVSTYNFKYSLFDTVVGHLYYSYNILSPKAFASFWQQTLYQHLHANDSCFSLLKRHHSMWVSVAHIKNRYFCMLTNCKPKRILCNCDMADRRYYSVYLVILMW